MMTGYAGHHCGETSIIFPLLTPRTALLALTRLRVMICNDSLFSATEVPLFGLRVAVVPARCLLRTTW
jgi:hypothetical protein